MFVIEIDCKIIDIRLLLMRHDLISQVKRIQRGSNSHLSTCEDEKAVPSKVVTSVVPATTSPMPKSERKEKCFLKEIE